MELHRPQRFVLILNATIWSMTAGIILCPLSKAVAATPTWKPVATLELAELKPKIEMEAAAEMLFWEIAVDERDYPHKRITTEYIRYKIFDPKKVESITRISGITYNWSKNRIEFFARLTLPNGKTQDFGREALKERSLAKQGKERGFLGWLSDSGAEITESFLAIPGVETGAVLEYQVIYVDQSPAALQIFTGQREGIPIRKLDFSVLPSRYDDQLDHRLFIFNKQSVRMTEDPKTKAINITATNLPSMMIEPAMGPATDYALTIIRGYEARNVTLNDRSGKVPPLGMVDPKAGPWAFYSSLINWFERDRGWPTKRVQRLAAEITANTTDPAEKARIIHEYVRAKFQLWLKRPPLRIPATKGPNFLDDVIDWENAPDLMLTAEDFLWLAVALNKSAGLDAHTVALPNRQLSRFYRENVYPVFLPNMAIAIRIGEEWKFSSPHHALALPFDLLPWQQEGQMGLLAADRKEDFIRIPAAEPGKSIITTLGSFEIGADGTLSGDCRRSFTGHSALQIRAQLTAATAEQREKIIQNLFGLDLKIVELTGGKIQNLDDADKPLELNATLRWPGFAVFTKDRLILRISPFRAEIASPFSATERRHPVHFPYRWEEVDRVSIRVPSEYIPEAPSAPAPMPGEALSFRTQVRYDKEKNTLQIRREFSSNLSDVVPAAYPRFREWHTHLTRADQHEIIFTKRMPSTSPAAKSSTEK